MGIDAVALLKVPRHTLPDRMYVRVLDDCVLAHTGARFGPSQPEMPLALRGSLVDALDAHDDPRGVFIFPDVAETRARTYEGVIAEVGVAGAWIPRLAAGEVPAAMLAAPAGTYTAEIAEMMRAIGPATLATLQRAAATGDRAGFALVNSTLREAVGSESALAALGQRLLAAAQAEAASGAAAMQARLDAAKQFQISAGGIDLANDPELRALVTDVIEGFDEQRRVEIATVFDAVKKPVKKTVKKPVKKTVKKPASKTTAKKPVKNPAKKKGRATARKAVNKKPRKPVAKKRSPKSSSRAVKRRKK